MTVNVNLRDGMGFDTFSSEVLRAIDSIRDKNECVRYTYNGETRTIRAETLLQAISRDATREGGNVSATFQGIVQELRPFLADDVDARVDINGQYRPGATPGQCVAEPARGPAIS